MTIVEIPETVDDFESHFIEDCLIEAIPIDSNLHAFHTTLSLVLMRFLQSQTDYILPINHSETLCLDNASDLLKKMSEFSSKKYVFDRKNFLQLCPIFEKSTVIDLKLLKFMNDGQVLEFENYNTTVHIQLNNLFYNYPNLNQCIPVLKHYEKFVKIAEIAKTLIDIKIEESFWKLNNNLCDILRKIEQNGLAVNPDVFVTHFEEKSRKYIDDNNLINTSYYIYTNTGRPSNHFGNINYAALNKDSGCRKSFVSRYGKNGFLILMDYSAWHPKLISHLINYDIPFDLDMYKFLAKYYFKKSENDLTEDDIKKSKGITFQQLYGGIKDEYLHIEYFKKTKEYIDHRWKYFKNSGYVLTPLYNRPIKPCHISEPYPNKLFNYLLQSAETEYGCEMMQRVLEYLNDKLTKLVLYTYDSILLDVCKDDGIDTLREIKRLMENNKFSTKVYTGTDYHSMEKINKF